VRGFVCRTAMPLMSLCDVWLRPRLVALSVAARPTSSTDWRPTRRRCSPSPRYCITRRRQRLSEDDCVWIADRSTTVCYTSVYT